MNLKNLYKIIGQRKKIMPKNSYVALLLMNENRMLKKIAEESGEVIIAAKDGNRQEIIWEISDLLFHILVLMNKKGILLDDIYAELEKRNKD